MSHKYNPLKDSEYLKKMCCLELDQLKSLQPICTLQRLGDDNKTPQWTLLSNGKSFGGDNAKELLESELIKLYEFIAREAQVVGYWETINEDYLKNDNPFNDNLLDGLPQNDWSLYYEQGSRTARSERASIELAERMSKMGIN